ARGSEEQLYLEALEAHLGGLDHAVERPDERLAAVERRVRAREFALLPRAPDGIRGELPELRERAQPGQVGAQVAVHAPQPGRNGLERILVALEAGIAQQRLDCRARRRPLRAERVPRGPAGLVALRLVRHRIGTDEMEIRTAEMRADGGGEDLGAHPAIEEVLDEQRGRLDQPLPPEVVHNLLQQLADVGQELPRERQAALERAVDEHALAETVDGVDARLVE